MLTQPNLLIRKTNKSRFMKKPISKLLIASATTAFLIGAIHSPPIKSQQIKSDHVSQPSVASLHTQSFSHNLLIAQANTDQYESADAEADAEAAGAAVAIIFLLILVICILIYLAPLGIALLRGSHLVAAVAVVNIFLGWTLIGWVVAFVMAVLPESKKSTVIVQQAVGADAGQSVETDENK